MSTGNYIGRKFDAFLVKWKANAERKPLIVSGARQVGKTESIRHFARKNYKNFIEINFAEMPHFKGIVRDGFSVEAILKAISSIDPSLRFVPNDTLLFFDEIQEAPEFATALKFFCQDGRFDVIVSGSLLGVHYKRIASLSVGYQQNYILRSLDFEEFLHAIGYGEDFVDDLLMHLVDVRPLSELTLSVIAKCFLDFCLLGGMPAVIAEFIRNRSFEGVLDLQRQILDGYRGDVRKYAEGLDQARILNVFNGIAPQLAKENKKFQITKVAKGARSKDYWGCVEWLQDAGVINRCNALNFPGLPIRGNWDDSRYKLYMADTGLLVALLDDAAQLDLRANRNLGVCKGGLYENMVAEALVKQDYDLVYYKREDSTLEEDFFVRDAQWLIPVEVKSGNNRSKSLRTLVSGDRYPEISWGIKFANANVGFENNILTMPYSTAFLLRRLLKARD